MTLFQQTPIKFQLSALVAVLALAYACWVGGEWWQWVLAFAGYFVYGCIGIVVGFHRYLAHGSFKLSKWKERVIVFIGHMAGTGSAISWVAQHIEHHKHSDTAQDPHSPRNGILAMLTLGYQHAYKTRSRTVLRMAHDPFYRTLHNYFMLIQLGWMAALFVAFGLDGVLFGHLLPVAFVVVGSALTNLLGHTIGTQRYDTKDDSRNSFIAAMLSWGEGWHNNHHRYPGRANFGEKWWELDVSGLMIRLIADKPQRAK